MSKKGKELLKDVERLAQFARERWDMESEKDSKIGHMEYAGKPNEKPIFTVSEQAPRKWFLIPVAILAAIVIGSAVMIISGIAATKGGLVGGGIMILLIAGGICIFPIKMTYDNYDTDRYRYEQDAEQRRINEKNRQYNENVLPLEMKKYEKAVADCKAEYEKKLKELRKNYADILDENDCYKVDPRLDCMEAIHFAGYLKDGYGNSMEDFDSYCEWKSVKDELNEHAFEKALSRCKKCVYYDKCDHVGEERSCDEFCPGRLY